MKKLHTIVYILFSTMLLFAYSNAAFADELVVTEYGRVGISTVNPSTLLSFGTPLQSKILSLYDDASSWYGFGIQPNQLRLQVGHAGARFTFLAGDTNEVMTINGTGDLHVARNLALFSADPYIYVNSDNKHLVLSGGNGWIQTGATMVLRGKNSPNNNNAHGIEMYAGAAERLRILANGNVGIGTSNPQAALDVNGSLRIAGGGTISCPGRMHVSGDELLYILNKSGVVIGKEWGGTGNLTVQGNLQVNSIQAKDLLLPYGIWKSNGIVGIGTTTPTEGYDFLNMGGAPQGVKVHIIGNVLINGALKATGIAFPSDARYKSNVETIRNPLEKISQLRGVTYDWIDKSRGEGRQVGIIAQEVEEAFPEIVHTDSEGYKSVEYSKLVAPLIEAVKELKAQVDTLQNENAQLVSENRFLNRTNQDFEERLSRLERLLSSKQVDDFTD